MASIMDLFKEKKKELYGNNGLIYIESRGTVNPPRVVALAASSPNAAADMIGNAVAGVAGGSAKRPDDTIFKGIEFFQKPVSLTAPTPALLRDAIKNKTSYFVKTEPNPGANLYRDIKNAIKSPGGAQSAAITALNRFGSKSGVQSLKTLRNQLKNPTESDTYGPKWSTAGNDARKPKTEDKKYSTHYKDADGKLQMRSVTNFSSYETKFGDKINKASPFDLINYQILSSLGGEKTEFLDEDLKKFKTQNDKINTPYVLFTLYGKQNKNILLPGAISGISEDYAPEVNSFRFVGSPFNLYRYGGVERSLKFDLKMYFVDQDTKHSMKRNLDKLRALVFPDENITAIMYNDTNQYSQLAFNPNLVYLTIYGLYDKVLGIIDSLSISIDDNTSWSTTDRANFDGSVIKPHPSIFNVSIGMKIIEHPGIKKSENGYSFEYGESKEQEYTNYFTGYNEYGDNFEKPEMKTVSNPAEAQIPAGSVTSDGTSTLTGVNSSSPPGLFGNF